MDWNSILTIGLAVITILNFAFGRGDKSKSDTADRNYRQGILDQQLKDIKEDLEDIKSTLGKLDDQISNKIKEAISNHIKEYHKGGRRNESWKKSK